MALIAPGVEDDATLDIGLDLQTLNHTGHFSRAIMALDQPAVTVDNPGDMLEQLGQGIRIEEPILSCTRIIEISTGSSSHTLTDISSIHIQSNLRSSNEREQLEEPSDLRPIILQNRFVELAQEEPTQRLSGIVQSHTWWIRHFGRGHHLRRKCSIHHGGGHLRCTVQVASCRFPVLRRTHGPSHAQCACLQLSNLLDYLQRCMDTCLFEI